MSARLDEICRAHTAFRSFEDLLDAKGGYRPTLFVSVPSAPELLELADAYDLAMAARGDDRRAYRRGAMAKCKRCGSEHLADRSCGCFDNGAE